MSTVMRKHAGPTIPPLARPRRSEKQLRRDRWTAVIVVAVMMALVALVIWLASLGGGVEHEGIDYWQLMP